MDENTKDNDESGKANWVHNQDLSFKRINDFLSLIRDALQKSVEDHKKELSRLNELRNFTRKP